MVDHMKTAGRNLQSLSGVVSSSASSSVQTSPVATTVQKLQQQTPSSPEWDRIEGTPQPLYLDGGDGDGEDMFDEEGEELPQTEAF